MHQVREKRMYAERRKPIWPLSLYHNNRTSSQPGTRHSNDWRHT